jgi:DNA-binding MarR family transcriptional regulator
LSIDSVSLDREQTTQDSLVLSEQITSLIHEIWSLARNISESSKKRSSQVGLEQYWILRFLYESGPKKIKDIAEKFGTTSSPVTISVKRLEGWNLVTRTRSKVDERVVTVSLTPAGKSVFESLRRDRRKDVAVLFESLSEVEKRKLSDLLEKVLVRARSAASVHSSQSTKQ